MLRAIAAELLAHPAWSIAVGVRPSPKVKDADVTARAEAIATAIRRFTRREKIVRVVPWSEVSAAPRAAEFGVGFLPLTPE